MCTHTHRWKEGERKREKEKGSEKGNLGKGHMGVLCINFVTFKFEIISKDTINSVLSTDKQCNMVFS